MEKEKIIKNYWLSILGLVNAWAKYNWAKKLYINATSPETKKEVWPVVVKYFGGDVEKIADYRWMLTTPLEYELASYARACEGAEIKPPFTAAQNKDLNWLFNHLKDADDYKSIRGKVKRRLEGMKMPEPIETLV